MKQSNDEHQFFASLPIQDTDAFNGEFRFIKADAGFDLPAAVVTEHNAPGVFYREDRVIGEQEPGLTARARTGDNHPEGVAREIGESNGEENNAGFAMAAAFAVVDHPMINGTFSAADLRGFVTLAELIDQAIAFFPTHDEAYLSRQGLE